MEEQIINNNILIATVFLKGLVLQPTNEVSIKLNSGLLMVYEKEDLSFHNSITWQFEVITKLEREGYYFELEKYSTVIKGQNINDICYIHDNRLSATFSALVELANKIKNDQ